MDIQINYLAVLVATVANFFFGFLWYTPLFGKAWAKELGIEVTGKPPAGSLAKGMIMNVIGNFLMAYVLAHNEVAWSFVPGMGEMPMTSIILTSAFFTWLGFYLPVDLNTVAWERKSWKFFFINTTYHLGMLIIAATILNLM
ncbi:MAG TPA: DUF1761 domain-containing protein [Cyclobacteriaceae bacterium]|nr:DUF1761 domain-containing protein [Cyclobacteriaceae bacterium]